jgi:hypothetical protein
VLITTRKLAQPNRPVGGGQVISLPLAERTGKSVPVEAIWPRRSAHRRRKVHPSPLPRRR